MKLLVAFLSSGTFRRLLVFALTAGVTLLNKRFHLGLDATDLAALAVTALGYILGSNAKEAAIAKADAAAAEAASKIQTTQQAVDYAKTLIGPQP